MTQKNALLLEQREKLTSSYEIWAQPSGNEQWWSTRSQGDICLQLLSIRQPPQALRYKPGFVVAACPSSCPWLLVMILLAEPSSLFALGLVLLLLLPMAVNCRWRTLLASGMFVLTMEELLFVMMQRIPASLVSLRLGLLDLLARIVAPVNVGVSELKLPIRGFP